VPIVHAGVFLCDCIQMAFKSSPNPTKFFVLLVAKTCTEIAILKFLLDVDSRGPLHASGKH
jgi:hypothetical protein